MTCGMGMIKYLLFIFNFIFALCGLAILAVGVVIHLQLTHLSDTLAKNVDFPSVTLIVVGTIIFVIAFFGCCGAIRESHCMTVTFASLMLTILIVQVAVAIFCFVVFKNTDTNSIDIRSAYSDTFKDYWTDGGDREVIDVVQSGLQCCGIDSAADFDNNGSNFNGTIPWSCCGNPEGIDCTSNIHNKSCVKQIQQLLSYAGTVLGGIALGIAGVELIGIIFALCLANSIKNAERRGYRV
ncbi:hypothetical protein KM043_014752 [Ampulex compressa]|nr:hypothetical protein KM043_014752 [Ampulex compressa]